MDARYRNTTSLFRYIQPIGQPFSKQLLCIIFSVWFVGLLIRVT